MAATREVDDGKQFSFFESFWRQLEMLDMQTRGEYVSAMCRMAFDGEDTEFENAMLQFGWSVMRSQVRQSVKVHKAAIKRGRASAEARRKRKERDEMLSETLSEKVSQRKERKGRERNRNDFPLSGDASMGAPEREGGAPGPIDFDDLPPMAHER